MNTVTPSRQHHPRIAIKIDLSPVVSAAVQPRPCSRVENSFWHGGGRCDQLVAQPADLKIARSFLRVARPSNDEVEAQGESSGLLERGEPGYQHLLAAELLFQGW